MIRRALTSAAESLDASLLSPHCVLRGETEGEIPKWSAMRIRLGGRAGGMPARDQRMPRWRDRSAQLSAVGPKILWVLLKVRSLPGPRTFRKYFHDMHGSTAALLRALQARKAQPLCRASDAMIGLPEGCTVQAAFATLASPELRRMLRCAGTSRSAVAPETLAPPKEFGRLEAVPGKTNGGNRSLTAPCLLVNAA